MQPREEDVMESRNEQPKSLKLEIEDLEERIAPGLVTICHVAPGLPSGTITITVDANAILAHLNRGDALGPCAS